MPAREINPFTALTRIRSVSQDTMIDEQSSASGHDYASAIGASLLATSVACNIFFHSNIYIVNIGPIYPLELMFTKVA